MHEDDLDEILLELSELNIITGWVMGEDPEGDAIMFDWDALKEYSEPLYEVFYEAHCQEIKESIYKLVEEGLLEERLDAEGEIWYSVPEDVREAIERGDFEF